MERLEVNTSMHFNRQDRFSILTVLEGSGVLSWKGGEIPAAQGQQFFLPAGMEHFTLSGTLTAVRCHPPGAAPLPPIV